MTTQPTQTPVPSEPAKQEPVVQEPAPQAPGDVDSFLGLEQLLKTTPTADPVIVQEADAKAKEETDAKATEPAPVIPGTTPPVEPAPVVAPATPEIPPVAEPTIDPVTQQLLAQQQQQIALLQQQTQQQQVQATQQSEPTEADIIADLVNQYAENINPALLEALRGDDPVKANQALSAVLAASNARVHYNLAAQVRDYMTNALTQQVPNYVQNEVQQSQQNQAVHNDFYGAHPDLNHPAVKPMVLRAAQQIMTQPGNPYGGQWSAAARDATAQAVRGELARFTQPGAQPNTQQTAQPGVQPSAQQFITGGSQTRQGYKQTGFNTPDDIKHGVW